MEIEQHLGLMRGPVVWGAMLIAVLATVWYQRHMQKYETRGGELKSEQAARDEKARADAEELRADIAEVHLNTIIKALDRANQQIAEQQPRRLTAEQRKEIVNAISPFEGQKVSAFYQFADTEAGGFAADFATVFRDAKWTFESFRAGSIDGKGKNVAVIVSEEKMDIKVAEATNALAEVLRRLNLVHPTSTIYESNKLKPDEIAIGIAHKESVE